MKVFASDYDGTFCRSKRQKVFEIRNNIRAVKKWQRAGNLFVFATGRTISLMKLEAKMRKLDYDFIVGLNGGIIISKANEILFRQVIKQDVAKGIINVIKEQKINFYSVTDGISTHYQIPFELKNPKHCLFKLGTMAIKSFRLGLTESLSQPVAQISVKAKSHDEANKFAKMINERFKGEVAAFVNLKHVDISAHNLSKATGIEQISKYHQIQKHHIYCMGDGHNDIPMLKTYRGFTLPEAQEEIKDHVEKVYTSVGKAIIGILEDQS